MNLSRRAFGAFALIVLPLAVLVATAPAARAELHIDLTHGQTQPRPIALPPFPGEGGNGQLGQQIVGVVSNDLKSSGLFQPLDPKSFIQDVSTGGPPQFGAWRQINAQALVTGTVQTQPDGKARVEFRLWDVFAEQQLAGFAYTTTSQNWRRIAHIIADEIYKRITGEDGYFDSRIVYIAESGPAQNRIKRLAIMDQDGANNQYLTDGRSLVLTPRFAPSAQEITYLSYASGVPRVYLFNIDTGQQESIGDFPGMTFAPRFSPDGNRVVLSKTEGGASNIYSLDLRTHHLAKLSDGGAIDTSPCFSPDGSKIAFNSDRGGSQQLYVMRTPTAAAYSGIKLRLGQIRDAGVVAARRFDRLHQDRRRHVLYRRHAPRRIGRAAADAGLLGRRPDLGAQWAGADVLPRLAHDKKRRRRRLAAVLDRLDGHKSA